MDHAIISMEQSHPTKDESKNDGETSRGHDITVVPTDERTSPGSDSVLNQIRSSLDHNGHVIHAANPRERTLPKVPFSLRKIQRFEKYFKPTHISLGPYHHGKRELQEFEVIKTMAMLMFIQESGKSFWEFFHEVRNMNHLTRAYYVDCSEEKYCDDTFALIMLRDGCLISYLLDVVEYGKWGNMLKLFVNHGSFLGYHSVTRDMVLLENQIPLKVLELLMNLRYNNNHKGVPILIKKFIYEMFWGIILEEDPDKGPETRFLLQCIKEEFSAGRVRDSRRVHESSDECPTYRSLRELKAKGIHFNPINYQRKSFSFKEVEFIPGFFYAQLKLPPLTLSNRTVTLLINMIAYELSPASESQFVISSYMIFLNELIASPDDVKELRSKRILLNDTDSDEEMFKSFKEILTDPIQDRDLYRNVRDDIEKHCSSKSRTWAAEIIYKYFGNPWAALGLFAAIAVLVLTFLQTYFAIYSGKR